MTEHDRFRAGVRIGRWSAPLSRRSVPAGSGAALAAPALGFPGVGVAPRLVHARQATPIATPAPEAAAFFVEFIHFEKFFAFFGVVLDEEQLAALNGLDAQTYRDSRDQFAANARRAAAELLADPAFAARVDRLPFRPGESVFGVGDSITDDLQSWLEILRHLLDLRRPGDQIRVVNEGFSGDTTTDGLHRFIPIVTTQPAWILCFLGTNDATRSGLQPTKTLVSLDETAKTWPSCVTSPQPKPRRTGRG